MGVDTALDGLEQRRLPVIAPTGHECHPARNAQARDLPLRSARPVERGLEGEADAQRVRRPGRHDFAAERAITRTALSRQPRSVGDEGDQALVVELGAQTLLVFDAADEGVEVVVVLGFGHQAPSCDGGNVAAEQVFGLSPEDASSRGRESDIEAQLDPVFSEDDGRAREHFLGAGVDPHDATLPAAAPAGVSGSLARAAREAVGQGEPTNAGREQGLGKRCDGQRHAHPKLRGSREGIALDMVDAERRVAQVYLAAQILVGAVAAAVDPREQLLELGEAAHAREPLAPPRGESQAGRARAQG